MPILGPLLLIAGIWVIASLLEEPCDFCDAKRDVTKCSDPDCKKNICINCAGYVRPYYKEWPVSEDDEGFYCPIHFEGRNEEMQKLKNAIDKSERVEVFSKNYGGGTPPITKNRWITTKSYRNRDDANRELRILAALEGCSVVVKAEFVKERYKSWENPNYVYSM